MGLILLCHASEIRDEDILEVVRLFQLSSDLHSCSLKFP